jgi:hypothetical protein
MDRTPKLTEVGEALVRARRRLEREELWTQHTTRRGMAVCILGAVERAAFECPPFGGYRDMVYRLVANVPHRRYIEPCPELANFNDHKDRTHAEVLALFDRAIAGEVR